MKTYELTFEVKSPDHETCEGTLTDINGILQDAIRDCSMEYQVEPIKWKELNQTTTNS